MASTKSAARLIREAIGCVVVSNLENQAEVKVEQSIQRALDKPRDSADGQVGAQLSEHHPVGNLAERLNPRAHLPQQTGAARIIQNHKRNFPATHDGPRRAA